MSESFPKRLAAFDFDHTIVNENTDTVVRRLLPKADILPYSDNKWKCWTYYMQDIFIKLNEKNISKSAITSEIHKIPPVKGMDSLIKTLQTELNFDVIIISDSNTYFIDEWLSTIGLRKHVSQIFSNPASFVDNLLEIKPYQEQTECKLSAFNMCKYKILEEFIGKQKSNGIDYTQVYFMGDGRNDYCAIKHLTSNDVGCVRYGYDCFAMLQHAVSGNNTAPITDDEIDGVNAEIFIWSDGNELLNFIKQKVKAT